jgi:thiamine-phosphate pyrophosphorylase
MLQLPRVCPILDSETLEKCGLTLPAAAAALIEGGAGILQIRHKGHWTRDVFNASRAVAKLCREAGTRLVINDRADFALLLEADLHVGQDDLSPRDARKLMGPDAVVGYSTHTTVQIAEGGGEPVDYLAIGPVFATASKRNPDPVVGVEGVRTCRGLVEKPLVAIGGITLENVSSVWAAGADSVAVIAALFEGANDGVLSSATLRTNMEVWAGAGR